MSKTAFIFPGQGAQYAGMGKDFYDEIPVCREVIQMAGEISGLDLPKICFTEDDRINITEYTQTAILSVEAAILKALQDAGISADTCAGLSLGEYGACLASKTLTYEDAFYLVRKRGIYMQEAVPFGGAMSAVIGADTETVKKICEETEGIVSVANYNCPGQVVITGQEEAVKVASEKIKETGRVRVLPLKVSGPFHSPMLKEAGAQLKEALEKITLHTPEIPYISNVTADYVTDAATAERLLVEQVSSSVRWQQSMERMLQDGVDTFLEIGPGKTLTNFMKKIDRKAVVYNIQNTEDFKKTVDLLLK